MLYVILVSFIILDILSGFIQATYNKEVSSQVMRQGIFHKVAYIIIVALAELTDFSAQYIDLDINISITPLIITYLCSMELVSTLENVAKMLPENYNNLKKIFKVKESKDDA